MNKPLGKIPVKELTYTQDNTMKASTKKQKQKKPKEAEASPPPQNSGNLFPSGKKQGWWR